MMIKQGLFVFLTSVVPFWFTTVAPSSPPPEPKYPVQDSLKLEGHVWCFDFSSDRSEIALTIVKQGWDHPYFNQKSGDVVIYSVKDHELVPQYPFSPYLINPIGVESETFIGYESVEGILRIKKRNSTSEDIHIDTQVENGVVSRVLISPDENLAIINYGRLNMVGVLDLITYELHDVDVELQLEGFYDTKGALVEERTFVSGSGQWYQIDGKETGWLLGHVPLIHKNGPGPHELSGYDFVFPSEGKGVYAIIDCEGLSVRNVADHSLRWRIELDYPDERITDLRFGSADWLMLVTDYGNILSIRDGLIEEAIKLGDINPELQPIFADEYQSALHCFVDVEDLVVTIVDGQLIRTTVDLPF